MEPIKSKSGELKNKNQQLDRWMEHYSELYLVELYLDDTVPLPSLPELTELDFEPSIAELSQASKFPVQKHQATTPSQQNY